MKIYITPLHSYNLSKRFLNVFILGASMMTSGILFHWSVMRHLNENFQMSFLQHSLYMLNLCPIKLWSRHWLARKSESYTLYLRHRNDDVITCTTQSYLLYIFDIVMPGVLRIVASLENPGIYLDSRRCMFSISVICFFKCGFHIAA